MARNHEMSGIMDWWRRRKQPKQPAGPPPPTHIDLYDVLRVPTDASSDDIKTAFRSLALIFHPDRNPDDPVAQKKYSDLTLAYSILGDDAQRAAYDSLREASAQTNEPSPVGRGLIPRQATQEAEETLDKQEEPEPDRAAQLAQWQFFFRKLNDKKENQAPLSSMFEIISNESPASQQIKRAAQNPHGRAISFQKTVSQIDTPSPQELFESIKHWPLDNIWDVVREQRQTANFHREKAMVVDVLAGAGHNPAELDLAEIFGIPKRQAEEFIRHRGGQALFTEILYPLFDLVTQIMGQLKPVDLPGQFFLDLDQTGRMIQLIYAESVARRPWE